MSEAMASLPASFRAADVPGGSILSSSDERLRLGFDCLMAQVPFWLAGQAQVVTSLVAALEHLNVSPAHLCTAVPLVNSTAALGCLTACPLLLSRNVHGVCY
jgi:hypothetical protein